MTVSLVENRPKRRDKLVIMAEILEIAVGGASKTHIMFKANLSFSQLNEYLGVLGRADLLGKSVRGRRVVYVPTEKGLEFVQMQRAVIGLLGGDGGFGVKSSLFSFDGF